jgi:hypothetical protein
MADNYDVVAITPVTEFIPPNKSRQVHEVTAMAQPSGVIFYLRFQDAAFNPSNVAVTTGAVANGLNIDSNVPGVIGISIEQDIDAGGNIVEYGVVTVQSTSGNSETEIRDKQGWLFTLDSFRARVAAARDKLDAIEEL